MRQDGWDCHIHVFDDRPVAGHYAPPPSTLSTIEAIASGLDVRRFVLIQPSVYGTDNALLLDTLRASGGRHRGVVVVDAEVDESELQAMHALGVRGVRFNLVSPVGNSEAAFLALAPRLREMGWHAQWHAKPMHLSMIAALHERAGVTAVLDHLAGFTPRVGSDDAVWNDLRRVAGQGGWVKVSGLYRLESVAPFADLHGLVAQVSAMFTDRCVWGSDWPHTFFHEPPRQQPVPDYGVTWAALPLALGRERAEEVLRVHPGRLYG